MFNQLKLGYFYSLHFNVKLTRLDPKWTLLGQNDWDMYP